MEEPQKSTKPEWEEGRYITLLGDPIRSDGTAFTKVTKNDVRSLVVGGGVCGGLLDIFNGTFPSSTMLGTSLLALGSSKIGRFAEYGFLGYVFDDALNKKCIDTSPDQHAVPTLDHYELQVKEAMVAGWGLAGIGVATMAAAAPSTWPELCVIVIQGAPVVLGGSDILGRFGKIKNGDWIIVDWPEPKKVEEPKKAVAERLALDMT